MGFITFALAQLDWHLAVRELPKIFGRNRRHAYSGFPGSTGFNQF